MKVNEITKKRMKLFIDDRPKSIDPWIEAGGIGILHTGATQTINELKKILNRESEI